MKHLKKVLTNTPLRMTTNMEPTKKFAWLPKKMSSGKIVWLGWYWTERYLTSVDPRHNWIRVTLFSEWEYFVKKMSD
jgi:hypothetical protein